MYPSQQANFSFFFLDLESIYGGQGWRSDGLGLKPSDTAKQFVCLGDTGMRQWEKNQFLVRPKRANPLLKPATSSHGVRQRSNVLSKQTTAISSQG